MPEFAVLPDLDAALVGFLESHADLAALHEGRVGTSLENGAGPAIRIVNLGGAQPWPWQGAAEFQVECWGGTELQAERLAATVCAAIYEARGPISGGFITLAFVTIRPFWRPDPLTNRPRYITQIQLESTPEGTP